jgi:hypothetical protein
MSQVTLDIIQGIAQAAANAYDGAHDEKGEPIKIGLKREDGHPIHDSRTVDGFKVKIDGSHVIITYQSDIKLKDVYANDFEGEMDTCCEDVSKWLKKEYKKVTGKSLSLTGEEPEILVQSTSRVRVFVIATKRYKIGGLEGVEDRLKPSEDRLDAKFKEFLGLGGLGSRPKNKNQKG